MSDMSGTGMTHLRLDVFHVEAKGVGEGGVYFCSSLRNRAERVI
jgi:hypothetical protein